MGKRFSLVLAVWASLYCCLWATESLGNSPPATDLCEPDNGGILCFHLNHPPQFPDLGDEYSEVPPPTSSEDGAGPAVATDSDARTYGSMWAKERLGSRSINARAQIYTDRGEEEYSVTDLKIPGIGFDYQHTRTYRSQETADRAQGANWQHNYQERIILARGTGLQYIQQGTEFMPPTAAWVRAGDYPGDN